MDNAATTVPPSPEIKAPFDMATRYLFECPATLLICLYLQWPQSTKFSLLRTP